MVLVFGPPPLPLPFLLSLTAQAQPCHESTEALNIDRLIKFPEEKKTELLS